MAFIIFYTARENVIYMYTYIHTYTHPHTHTHIYIQGVPGGMCQTSGECPLS